MRDEGVETVSLYRNGPFSDLCRGPHGPSTGRIKAFKLNSLAGAYWRGDENRQMLTRIYGTAFFSKKDLEEHLERIEEAKARDHRAPRPAARAVHAAAGVAGDAVLAAERDRAAAADRARGARAARSRRLRQEIKTPQVLDEELWHRSGHWDNYRENMYFVEPSEREGDERRFALKPMNCPGACLVFGSERHSYRELPLRLAEFGDVSRYEREGVLHGLLRVRAFTQDDGHVYCTLDQVADEVDVDLLRRSTSSTRASGSTRCGSSSRPGPEKSIGTDEQWERAEGALREALERQGRDYEVSPGEGTFYGPEDRLPRHRRARPLLAVRHLPARLPDAGALRARLPGRGQRRPPAGDDPPGAARLDGALRGILIEHHAGRFPAWLAPVQAAMLPVSDRHNDYAAQAVAARCGTAGRALHASTSARSPWARRSATPRSAKFPYMLVVGDREEADGAARCARTPRATSGVLGCRSTAFARADSEREALRRP